MRVGGRYRIYGFVEEHEDVATAEHFLLAHLGHNFIVEAVPVFVALPKSHIVAILVPTVVRDRAFELIGSLYLVFFIAQRCTPSSEEVELCRKADEGIVLALIAILIENAAIDMDNQVGRQTTNSDLLGLGPVHRLQLGSL